MEKKEYDVILRGRRFLTDYEKELLIPELKLKLEALKRRFSEIIQLCEVQKGLKGFTENIHLIINPSALPSNANESIAENFFNGIKAQAQEEGVDDINRILNQHKDIKNVKEFLKFLTDVNILCSSLLVIKNRLCCLK